MTKSFPGRLSIPAFRVNSCNAKMNARTTLVQLLPARRSINALAAEFAPPRGWPKPRLLSSNCRRSPPRPERPYKSTERNLTNLKERRALRRVIEFVIIGVTRKRNGPAELDANVNAVLFLPGGNNRVGRHVVIGSALRQLFFQPVTVVTLRHGQVNLVLHYILEIVSINRNRNVHVACVENRPKHGDEDNKFKARSALLISHSSTPYLYFMEVSDMELCLEPCVARREIII